MKENTFYVFITSSSNKILQVRFVQFWSLNLLVENHKQISDTICGMNGGVSA